MGGTLDDSDHRPSRDTAVEDDEHLSCAATASALPRGGSGDVFDVSRHRVPVALQAGERFGRFSVEGQLGQGGMATVLRARDETLDREVALKLLHLELDSRHEPRLLREAQALARLSHPNVVQVYEVGEHDGQPFIAMELVRGETLSAWQAERRPWREAVQIYIQAGRGLAAAHAQGLVHRDFKPSNAILDEDGRVRVLDFGLARQVGADDAPSTGRQVVIPSSALEADLTRTGSLMGTLAYMAPEQRRGEVADEKSDQFSFFVSLYEAIYGERPYPRDTSGVVFGDETEVRAPRVDVTAPPALRAALLRGVAVDPSGRFPSMNDALAAMEQLVAPKRRWLAMGAVGAVAVAGVGAMQYARVGFRCEGADAIVHELWGETQRTALEASMQASSLPYAEATWSRVSAKLDAYGEQWAAQQTEACEATRVTETQPESVLALRTACLERGRAALEETVSALLRDGESAAMYGTQVVAHLPALDRCQDVEALQAEVPPPSDPDVLARVGEIRQTLAEVRALRDTAALDESATLADEALAAARNTDYAPLLAEALLESASSKIERGEYANGEALLLEAYETAAEAGHRTAEAFAAAELAYVVGSRQDRRSDGMLWGRIALAISRRPNAKPDAEPRAASNYADVHLSLGDGDSIRRAIELYRLAAPAWEAARGVDDPELGAIYHNLAIAYRMAGDMDASLEALERARELTEGSQGPDHPHMAEVLETLGNFHANTGAVEKGLDFLEQALAIKDAALGPSHPQTIFVRMNYARVLIDVGRTEQALAVSEQAVTGLQAAESPPFVRAEAHLLLGRSLLSMKRADEALPALETGLRWAKEVYEEGSLDLAAHEKWLARALAELGRTDEARMKFSAIYALVEAAVGKGHYDVVPVLLELAELELNDGRPEAGRPFALDALAIMEKRGEPPGELAEARFLAGRLLPDEERGRARALVDEARSGFVELGGRYEEHGDAAKVWLASHPATP